MCCEPPDLGHPQVSILLRNFQFHIFDYPFSSKSRSLTLILHRSSLSGTYVAFVPRFYGRFMVALDSLLRTVEPVKEWAARVIVRRCWWRSLKAPELVVAEPIPCVWLGCPGWGEGAAWNFSFVGLRDRSAGA